LRLSVCPEPIMPFKHPCMAHTYFPERLYNYCQCVRYIFRRYVKNWCCSFVGSIVNSHQTK
jgi:hypothetical protein